METGQASEPTGVHVTEYAVRQAERDLYRDRVSLSTVNGRVKGDFELPADSLTPYERYVLSEDVEQDVIWTVPTPGCPAIVRDVVTNHVVGPVSR